MATVVKKWYTSKIIWVNAVALVGGILVGTGVLENPITPEIEVFIFGALNFVLRFVTKEEIKW